MAIPTDRMLAMISAVARFASGGLVGPDQDDPSPLIGPKARAASDPMPGRALLGAQAIITFTAAQTGRGGDGAGLAEFLDEYCGTHPRPHVAGTIAELAAFTEVLHDGAFKGRLQEATAALVERAYGRR